jgi:hypothetical protein
VVGSRIGAWEWLREGRFRVVVLVLGGGVLGVESRSGGRMDGLWCGVPEGWIGTVSAHDRFVVNVSAGTALGQTFAPLPPRRAPPLLRAFS